MNTIITQTVKYHGKEMPVNKLKPASSIKVEVECKHGRRWIRWSKRHQVCRKCAAEAGAYNTSPKGRKITWGDKISKAKKGKLFTDDHKMALSVAQYDCKKENWPGFYKKREIHFIRDSYEYVETRKQVFKRDDYRCTITGKRGKLAMHHIVSMNTDLSKATDMDNLVTLLDSVHREFHNRYGKGNNTIEQFEEFKVKYLISS